MRSLKMLMNSKCFLGMSMMILLTTRFSAQGQQSAVLNIKEVYQLARNNYPLTKQHSLIVKTSEYTVSNAGKGYLPVWSMNGQATYQSTVTNFPFSNPALGLNIPEFSQDQYKIYVEGMQTIYDGGLIKNQKQVAKTTEAIQEQNLEVELYQLYNRVNELFFGVLLIDEQLKQNSLLLNDVQNGIEKTKALLANGMAYRSNVDELNAQFLQTEQDRISLVSSRKAYVAMLALFINRPLDVNTVFEKPLIPILENTIKRPELLLFGFQQKTFNDQHKFLKVQLLPRFGLFAQGGYGRPGLNMLSNNFSWYYLAGLKLTWNFGSLYSFRDQVKLLKIGQETIDLQRETFLLNTSIVQKQQIVGIDRYKELLETDDQIIALRMSVKMAADAQLRNGVLTVHDYIAVITAENKARQNRVLHETQLLQALYNYQNITGNAEN